MNKVNEMKKIIKPLIKECLTEILMEEGLMKLVKENVRKEVQKDPKEVTHENYSVKEKKFMQNNATDAKISLNEAKKKLLKEIAMTGFDPFEGSEPLPEEKSNQFHEEGVQEARLLEGIQGSGIDISRLMGANKQAWNFYNNALKNGKKE